jgi:hypothetical protein
MKKGVVELTLFVLFLLVLFFSGVFAAPPVEGTCSIVAKADCDTSTEGYALIGLSAANNAHAQQLVGRAFADWYPYVLCCAFGNGNKVCNTTVSNKVLGLSSDTNAHAEVPSLNNYQTWKICYEDLVCRASTTGCSISTNEVEIVNLSSPTNAHVGTGAGFQTAICCTSKQFLSTCQLTAARWELEEAIAISDTIRQGVRLEVTGNDAAACDNQAVNFTLTGGSSPVTTLPTAVGFNGKDAIGIWYVEHQTCGVWPFTSDCSYRFNATIVRSIPLKTMRSSNTLTVTQGSEEDLPPPSSCSDYKEKALCESDESLYNVSGTSDLTAETSCTDPGVECFCTWDETNNNCTLGYILYESGLCGNGFTLCRAPSNIDYCYPGASCPTGQTAPSDGVAGCGVEDSCASDDCNDGDTASCVTGATCKGDKCFKSGATVDSPLCNYGFTLCQEPVGKKNYCYPGAICLTGNNPVQDGDKKCEVGEGCLLSADSDCKEGDQDSCTSELFCSSGRCSSLLDPISLGSVGGCRVTQTITKACDEEPVGYKTLKWIGVWTGDEASKTGTAYSRCITGGTTNVPCPAQVALPFFDSYGLAITVAVIALVYLSLIFRRKFKKKK